MKSTGIPACGLSAAMLFLALFLFSGCTSDTPISGAVKQQKRHLLAGEVRAVAYSGFRHGQHPDRGSGAVNPSEAEILEDLRILSKDDLFNLIRLYDSNENSEMVLKVIRDHGIRMKVLLGAWLDAEFSNHEGCWWLSGPIPQETLDANRRKNERQIDNTIRLANEYNDIVVAVNIGNEALVSWNDHMVPLESVVAYVRQVQAAIEQPVTVADNFAWWRDHGAPLAEVVDFIMVHTYPLWEGKDIDEGLSFTIENIQEVRKTIPDSPMIIGEAGWATIANEFGERASEEKQARYFRELYDWAAEMNITAFFFEAFDEDWKPDGNPDLNPLGAEKHWGLFTVDRKAKQVMYDRYPELMPER
ncbi:glycosyl hydrolase [bacterium]|nr:glycosyl hydrolase [bacterium]